MKKIFSLLIMLSVLLLVGCEGHTHTFSDTYSYDETHHWYDATCDHEVESGYAVHQFTDWNVIEEATNNSTGLKKRSCKVCMYEEEVEIPSTNHEHEYETTTYDPTCTKGGYTYNYCSCGDSYISDEVPPLDHNYGDWKIDRIPTDTSKGVAVRICNNDKSHVEVIELPILNEDDYEVTVVELETCEKEGKRLFVYNDIKITVIVPMLNHNYDENYSYDETHHWRESLCGHDAGYYLEHTYGEWDVTVEPTEDELGYKVRYCTVCEYEDLESIPKLDHVHVYEEFVTDPTCTQAGYTTFKCKCGDEYLDNYVDIVDHEYGNWFNQKRPTLDLAGELRKDCYNCDHYVSFELPVLNEEDYTLNVITEVGCQVNGEYQYNYVKDGLTFTYYVTLEMTGHTYDDTLSFDSYYHYYASNCGHEYFKKDQEKHNIVNYECSVCDFTFFEFELINDSEYALVGFNSKNIAEIVIPDTYKGLPVTVLGENLFRDYTSALYLKITFGTNIKRIEPNALFMWHMDNEIYYNGDVEDYCKIEFADFQASLGINFAPDIYFMIDGEYQLVSKELLIPDTVESIPFEAFFNWQKLEKITIPYIGPTALYDEENEYFGYVLGLDNNKHLSRLKEIVLTGGTILYSNSFNSSNAKIIKLPDSLVEIEESACSECPYLGEIVFSENSKLTTIGNCAFGANHKMYRFVIPPKVTSMHENTFQLTDTIKELINLSNFDATTLRNFGEYIIDMISNYATSMANSKIKVIDGYVFGGFDNGTILLDYIGDKTELILPSLYKGEGYDIGISAFRDLNITKITIPNTIGEIGKHVFDLCDNLKEVIFEANSSLHTIEYGAFKRTGIEHIIIPASVKNLKQTSLGGIPKVEFEKNSVLTNIDNQVFQYITDYLILPKGVIEIKDYAFEKCGEDFVLYFESDKLPETLSKYWNADLGDRYYFYSEKLPMDNIEKYWYYDVLGTPRLWSDYDKFNNLNYVAFGDSITYGVDGVNGGRMENPYPTIISSVLSFNSFTNLAVSGATYCTNSVNRFNMTERILSYTDQADIISILLGVNDFAAGLALGDINSKDNTTIYGSLYLICEHLKNNYSDSYIFFMTPFDYKYGNNQNSNGYVLKDVRDAVITMASKYNFDVLDLYQESGYKDIEMNQTNSDGLHPSQEFMKNYAAPMIVDFIVKNYE